MGLIKVGNKMKKWIAQIIKRDFGDVSVPLGLYHILKYWDSLPSSVRRKICSNVEYRRMRY